jgi:hypothetical protein
MRREQGVTLTGVMMFAVILIFALLLSFKIGPAYFEYLTIKKQLQALAADPVSRGTNRKEFNAAFTARQTMENITAIGAGDITITREGNEVMLSSEYSKKVRLFGNLSACMDFEPTSK